MIVGIDGNEANVKKRVGVNQYAFELLKNIHKLGKPIRFIVYLKKKPQKDLPEQNFHWQYKIIKGRGLWIITKLMPNLFLNKEKPNVFFAPSHYLPLFAPCPMVSTIHDLGYLKFSEQFRKYDFWQLKIWSAISIFISKAIIAVSNSTKKDIVRHYPFASKKIFVAPHGYDKTRFNTEISKDDVRRVKNKYSIVNDYVLFISTLKPSKNIEGLLEAWKLLIQKRPKIRLIIAGKKGWLYESIFEKTDKLGLKDSVIFTGFIPEEDKPVLIAGAKGFVLPSFWEGFGMDALNAMACGVPVVVSKIDALEEVVGQAGILVDPDDIKSMAEGIEKVLSLSKIEYNKLVEKGLSQAKKFSWEKTARKTLAILEKAGINK